MCLGEALPHTYFCTYFYSTKQKTQVETKLYRFESRSVKILLNKCLKCLNFFLLKLLIYFGYFYHGKLGMMGNLAGWKHGERMHEELGYLHNGSSQDQNKMQKLRVQPTFAFLLLGSLHLCPFGAKERLWECWSFIVFRPFSFFYSLQKVSRQQILEGRLRISLLP
jgi:hypothetical protein